MKVATGSGLKNLKTLFDRTSTNNILNLSKKNYIKTTERNINITFTHSHEAKTTETKSSRQINIIEVYNTNTLNYRKVIA